MSNKDVTFIIPIFNLNKDRLENLKFILSFLLKTDKKIILAEQTNFVESNITDYLTGIVTEQYKDKFRHELYFHSSTLIHKTGIINWAVKNFVETRYAWVSDVDFYMKFESALNTDWNENFIKPYSFAKKLSKEDSEKIIAKNSITVSFSDNKANYISLYSALSFIFDKKVFLEIGGMNESIFGWGQEDVEFNKRLSVIGFAIQELNYKGIHLWHTANVSTPLIEENIKIEKRISDKINNFFDKIYCINLSSRTKRWKNVEKQFRKYNLNVTRFEAINGKNLPKNNILLQSELGCLHSHLEIFKEAKKNNFKKILIFEDDVCFSNDFLQKIECINNISWKILYLGASQHDWSDIKFYKEFYSCKNTLGTFAYAINTENCNIYDILIEEFSKENAPADRILAKIQERYYGDCYTVYPNIAIADVRESDIRPSQNLSIYAQQVKWDLANFSALSLFDKNPSKDKIAFLFLTVGDLHNESRWLNFFKDASDKATIYFHTKHVDKLTQKIAIDNQIEKKVETKWGTFSLIEATNLLIAEALKDEGNKFFVLVSESCIPLYNFNYIYDKIITENKSWIFYYKWKYPQHKNRFLQIKDFELSFDEFYKQSQYLILNRFHAELVWDNPYSSSFITSPVPDEHYYVNVLNKLDKNFKDNTICYPATYVYRASGKYKIENDNYFTTHPIKELFIEKIQKEDARSTFFDVELVKDEQNESLFFRKIDKNTIIHDIPSSFDRDVTFLIKSFNRKDCVINLIKSIRKYYPDTSIVIVDDSVPLLNFDEYPGVKTYNIEFDSGLAAGRNFGITKIHTKYFVLLDDDFEFTAHTNIQHLYNIISKNEDLDILGGQVIENGAAINYFGNFVYDEKNKMIYTEPVYQDMGEYKKCHLILNFFIANTKKIQQHQWDNRQKLAEHTAFFFGYKDKLKVGYVENVSVLHKRHRTEEYASYRKRGDSFFEEWMDRNNITFYINSKNVLKINSKTPLPLEPKKRKSFLVSSLGVKNLSDIDKILRKEKIPYWLQDGTLLGYYREKNFIGHDSDTDIGIMFKDFSVEAIKSLEKIGFKVTSMFGRPEDCLELSLVRFHVKTDIFFYYEEEDYIYHSAFSPKKTGAYENRIDYRYKKFNTKEIDFFEKKFFVPVDELKFILTKYGENWAKPDPTWDWCYSPKNHHETELIVPKDEALKKFENWKTSFKKKKKRVITYGTFDTLHYGHLEILKKAKEFGDYLIVGLSTDKFNSLKGKESKFSYAQRYEWLKSISYVDEIIPETNWEQKENDVKDRNIDVMVMGDDWVGKFDYLPCRVIYLQRTPEISSTKIKSITQ